MATWYYMEPDGNLLTLTAEKPPAWFALGNPWADTAEDAYERQHSDVSLKIMSAKRALRKAESDGELFRDGAAISLAGPVSG